MNTLLWAGMMCVLNSDGTDEILANVGISHYNTIILARH